MASALDTAVIVSTALSCPISIYMHRKLLYQTVGYTKDNQDPSEDHINQSLVKAFQMPAGSRVHYRVWLPHRDGGTELVDRVWDWFINRTTGAVSQSTIKNCGHIAIFMMQPEPEGKYDDAVDSPLHKDIFKDGPFEGERKLEGKDDILHFVRNLASFHYISAMEYCRQLQDFGYDVGFQGCVIQRSKSFNEEFAEYFPGGNVLPVMITYAGTKASAVKHSFQRGMIDTDMVKDQAFIQPKWLEGWKNMPTESMPDNCAEKLFKWNDDKSELLELSNGESMDLQYKKFPFRA